MYARGVSPFYMQRAKGSHAWDVDGNEFIDWVSGLGAIILGHHDPDVDAAVINQLDEGVIFSLPHPIEIEVSELLCEIIPSAEMVRFGKNGSDVTSAAVRLARAYTNRDHIACCGYHGWQDWYIGITPRNLGVPSAIRSLTHPFEYGNIESLDRIFKDHPNQVACVIMEAMNSQWPPEGWLNEIIELTHKHNALFILDEMLTGFRFGITGAQGYFNIDPDLSCFGKGIANGFPLSALVGKAEVMRLIDKIHFSGTYGGDCIALAAAKATITKMQNTPVALYLYVTGETLQKSLKDYLKFCEYDIRVSGHPAWTHLLFPSDDIKWLFMQEVIQEGILTFGTHLVTYAHGMADLVKTCRVYQKVFATLHEKKLEAKPVISNFKIRWF